MPSAGDRLTLRIERPAVGGRMIARHEGAVVLVAGAIPGEQVVARVEGTRQRTVFATTVDVLEASPDRVEVDPALRCAGHVLAHMRASRQVALKSQIVADAFRRLARLEVPPPPTVDSPADGYRTRARAHVRRGRWGFFAEGSHELCSIAGSRQLSEQSTMVLEALCAAVADLVPSAEVAWLESVAGDQRVATVRGQESTRARPGRQGGLDGLGWVEAGAAHVDRVWGESFVTDRVRTSRGLLDVQHHTEAFFQGNRFLLQPLVDEVAGRIDRGPVADLYAGVGLFGLRLAADGRRVIAVEGDAHAVSDLRMNAGRASGVDVYGQSVEAFAASGRLREVAAAVVDPPRRGLTDDVTRALIGSPVSRVVYVSCDPATLARDVKRCVDAGFALSDVRAFDLFPRTAHVETVVTLDR